MLIVIFDEDKVPILGLPSCREIFLVKTPAKKRVDALGDSVSVESTLPSEFPIDQSMFTGVGQLPVEHSIKLKLCTGGTPAAAGSIQNSRPS